MEIKCKLTFSLRAGLGREWLSFAFRKKHQSTEKIHSNRFVIHKILELSKKIDAFSVLIATISAVSE